MKNSLIAFLIALLFLVATVLFDRTAREDHSEHAVGKTVGERFEHELSRLQATMATINDSTVTLWSTIDFTVFLLDSGVVTAWSNNNISIDPGALTGEYDVKLVQSPKRDLILCRKLLGSTKEVVGIIPLRLDYDIINQYVGATWNDRIFPAQAVKISAPTETSGTPVRLRNGVCYFRISLPENLFMGNLTALAVAVVALAFFCLGIFFGARALHRKRRYIWTFAWLFTMLALTRIAMVQFGFPSRWMYSPYFDPRFFASSSFNASVGDFALNALIVAIAAGYLFHVYFRVRWVRKIPLRQMWMRGLVATALTAFAFFSFLFPALFIEAIFHDSSISIDITSEVTMTGLKLTALAALMVGSLSSYFFVHIFLRWTKLLLKTSLQFGVALVLGASIFMIYFLGSGLNYWPTALVGLGYFPLAYHTRYFRALRLADYKMFSFLLVSIIAYSMQGAFVVARFSQEKELRSMFRAATNVINRDVLAEFLLNSTVNKIAGDKFIISTLGGPVGNKDFIRQKVRTVHLNNYFDKYDVKVKLFYADGTGADNESGADFASSIQSVQNDANKTNYESVYYVRSAISETAKRYLVVIPIKRNTISLGFVVIDLVLKQVVPQHVYPELLIDNRFNQSIRDKNYSYAFFSRDRLVESTGTFNFDRDFDLRELEDPALYSQGVKRAGDWLVAAEDEVGKKAIVSSQSYPLFSILVNFSFHFVLGIGLLVILLLAYAGVGFRGSPQLNYSAKVQVYVYLAFILPLVIVSGIALKMINQSDEIQLEKEIRERGRQMTEVISPSLEHETPRQLHTRLIDLTQAAFSDATVYDPSGKLVATSQPGIFSYQLLMPLANRAAWEKIVNEKYNVVQVRSRVGTLEYNSLFFVIKPAGRTDVLGMLELPFFRSDSEPAKINVLSNILATFVVVFILFSYFAFKAIHTLTSPLVFMAKKLKTTSLGNNQAIEWKANDEIGLMVKEYNRMLDNLEKKKMELAKSEKESAWREIAKQVAHEIKNPLTPMKLTLQQMELGMGAATDERTRKSIQTMLSQVEILNEIAGSFSAFATMPTPVVSRVEIAGLLKGVIALFGHEGNARLRLKPTADTHVLGDPQLLGRIFGNIILNAIQSEDSGRQVDISLTVETESDWCIVSVRDNGRGIEPDLRDKIFLPHFSTKKTGSGLGLAIAKQGIEQMGGTIWFETGNSGTSFFVRLPIAL